MKDHDFADLKLFITGPTYLRPEVRAAAMLPEFGHRDSENVKRFGPIIDNLKKLAGCGDDYEVILFNGSGSTPLEASVRSLVADGETILHASVGAFGDLYHKMSVLNGKNAAYLKFEAGKAVDPDVLVAAMAEHQPAVVAITHNETATGVTNDIKTLCRLIRENGALALVDGVSIFGGAPLDLSEVGCAMYSTATQKALGLPAGFGIAFVNAEAEKKAARVTNKGYAMDILQQLPKARQFQTLSTPNGSLANQMWLQLDYIVNEEGVETRFERHRRMRDMVEDFAASLPGYEMFAPAGYRSVTASAVMAPMGVTVAALKSVKEAMRGKGYLFDPGYGKLNADLEKAGKRLVFRIGHMGEITPAMLEQYLDDLRAVLP